MNIDDVAREAGVGIGTVSRVLNGSPQVAAATRRRVLEVMHRLHYRPNRQATALARGASTSVAVIVGFLTLPSVVARLAGVVAVLDAAGYETVVCNVETAEQRERQIAALGARHRVDGVIVVSLPLSSAHLDHLARLAVPLVLLDADHAGAPRYVIDNVAGGRIATEHLLALGHTRIGFLGDGGTPSLARPSTTRRLRGYRDALSAAGVPWDPDLVRIVTTAGPDPAYAPAEGLALLDGCEPPTAVFAASDATATGVIRAASERGVQIPEDLSVIGFDDLDLAQLLRLSTVRQPLAESGREAAARLCRLLDGDPGGRVRSVLPIELVHRATTAPPPLGGRAPASRSPTARAGPWVSLEAPRSNPMMQPA